MAEEDLLGKANALLARYRDGKHGNVDLSDVPVLTEVPMLPEDAASLPPVTTAPASSAPTPTEPRADDFPMLTEVVELPSILTEVATGISTEGSVNALEELHEPDHQPPPALPSGSWPNIPGLPTLAKAPVLEAVPPPQVQVSDTAVTDATERLSRLFEAELQNFERRVAQCIADSLQSAPTPSLQGDFIAARLRPALETAVKAALDVVMESTCNDIARDLAERVRAEVAAEFGQRMRAALEEELRVLRSQLPPH